MSTGCKSETKHSRKEGNVDPSPTERIWQKDYLNWPYVWPILTRDGNGAVWVGFRPAPSASTGTRLTWPDPIQVFFFFFSNWGCGGTWATPNENVNTLHLCASRKSVKSKSQNPNALLLLITKRQEKQVKAAEWHIHGYGMGNKIPRMTQVSASEYYLHDLLLSYNLVLKEVLGRGRFFKSILCKHDEGLVLVKVYFKRGNFIDLREYERRLFQIKEIFHALDHPHIWPFQVHNY